MLRHGCKVVVQRSCHYQKQISRQISGSNIRFSKNTFSINRQGKVMSKLFGERVSGSKKRWYPTTDGLNPRNGGSLLFKASQLGKPGGAGKNTSRRSAVLNKLFMEEISGLLATGSIAEHFLGRGLQLTKVKIAPDFARVNVYWMGSGEPQMDGKLADDLKHYSGFLRHELSQLRVMGEVPRIHFVQDKTFANMEHVEALLRNMDFREKDSESEEMKIDFRRDVSVSVKQEFYGNKMELGDIPKCEHPESLPPMRHDVFGLDHRGIMSKIFGKMRKTKQAWEMHNERLEARLYPDTTHNATVPNTLKNINLQLEESSIYSEDVNFKKFLAQRQNRKNTPERKKYRKADDLALIDAPQDTNVDIMSMQKDFFNQEDYLHEDNESEDKL